MKVRSFLFGIVALLLVRCNNDDYESGTPPTVAFSTLQLTDSSATLQVDIITKGNVYYKASDIHGLKVAWYTEPFILSDTTYALSPFLDEGDLSQPSYQLTLNNLRSATTYYVNSYHAYNEFKGDAGDFSEYSLGKENFQFTTLPN